MFDAWRAALVRQHPEAAEAVPGLSGEWAKLIADRLRDGVAVEQLELAVRGCWLDGDFCGKDRLHYDLKFPIGNSGYITQYAALERGRLTELARQRAEREERERAAAEAYRPSADELPSPPGMHG